MSFPSVVAVNARQDLFLLRANLQRIMECQGGGLGDKEQQDAILASGSRRGGRDRRHVPTPWFSRFTLRGSRRRIRRDDDLQRGRYVDRADGPYLGGVVALVALILLDAMSTLFILGRGGSEENPLMASLIARGIGWFLLVKLGPLPFAFLLLSVARYFGWIRWALGALLVVYGLLAAYHLRLLFQILAG